MIQAFCGKTEIPAVPFVGFTKFTWKNMAELKEYARGDYDNGTPREGIVCRAMDDSPFIPDAKKDQHGCFSFKVINDDFAVKYP
jgi:hypothetical protein